MSVANRTAQKGISLRRLALRSTDGGDSVAGMTASMCDCLAGAHNFGATRSSANDSFVIPSDCTRQLRVQMRGRVSGVIGTVNTVMKHSAFMNSQIDGLNRCEVGTLAVEQLCLSAGLPYVSDRYSNAGSMFKTSSSIKAAPGR